MGRKESNPKKSRFIQNDSEVSNSILDLAKKEIKHNSNQTKKKQKKLVGISVPILVTMLLFLLILPFNLESSPHVPPEYGAAPKYDYTYLSLTKEETDSIELYNEKNNTSLLSIHQAEITNTYQLFYKSETKIIEEHYIYKDVECVLLACMETLDLYNCPYVNLRSFISWGNYRDTIIYGAVIDSKFYSSLIYGDFLYYIWIDIEDKELINEILSNFT